MSSWYSIEIHQKRVYGTAQMAKNVHRPSSTMTKPNLSMTWPLANFGFYGYSSRVNLHFTAVVIWTFSF